MPDQLLPAASSCRVPGWVVFGPGYHKGQLYSPADCRRMVANFARLSAGSSPYLKAKAKLGHDDQQRLANSLGYPSCGTITGCRLTKDSQVEIDVDDVPLGIGAEINAGRINDGSIEIDDESPDPKDPARVIPGPILTGVAFLGEEQPAVKGCPPPKAMLPDKSVVPKGEKPAPWLANLLRSYVEVAAQPLRFSVGGRPIGRRIVRFSEVIAVLDDPKQQLREQLLQSLSGLGIDISDPAIAAMGVDQLNMLINQMNGQAFAAAMKAKFSQGPQEEIRSLLAELGQSGPLCTSGAPSSPQEIVDAAVAAGRIPEGDGPVWVDAFTNAFNRTVVGDRKKKFSALAADLQSRPAGRYGPLDDPFVRGAMEHTPRGRRAMAEADADRLKRGPERKTFSDTDGDDEFVRGALERTAMGRRALAAASK